MNKKVLALPLLTLLVSGCASLGEQEYGCSGIPEGKRCMSTRDVYRNTHDGNALLSTEVSSEKKEQIKPEKTEVTERIATSGDAVIDTFVTPRLPDRPVPIRTPAQVMRIWVSTWEDQNGSLIAPGYVYTEIEPRRWVIGKRSSATQGPRVFKPLSYSKQTSKEK